MQNISYPYFIKEGIEDQSLYNVFEINNQELEELGLESVLFQLPCFWNCTMYIGGSLRANGPVLLGKDKVKLESSISVPRLVKEQRWNLVALLIV